MKFYKEYHFYKLTTHSEFDEFIENLVDFVLLYLRDTNKIDSEITNESPLQEKLTIQIKEQLREMIYEEISKFNKNIIFINLNSGYILSNTTKLDLSILSAPLLNRLPEILVNSISNNLHVAITNLIIFKAFLKNSRVKVIYTIKPIYSHTIILLPTKKIIDYEELDVTSDFFTDDGFIIKNSNYKNKLDNVAALFHESNLKGIRVNETYWYFDFEVIEKYLYASQELKWLYLKTYLTQKSSQNKNKNTEDTILISEYFSDTSFTKLLTKLKDWYYIESETIPSKYLSLFENNVINMNLTNKSFEKIDFIAPNIKSKTALGIYNRNLDGDTSPNLSYWLRHQDNEYVAYPNSINNKPKIKTVRTLKPKFGFYLLESFFEDYLKSILEDLKEKKHIKDFIQNVDFGESNHEIDFIVLSNNNKIYKIEAKKTLTKFNIDQQKEKDENFISKSNFIIFDKFYIIGFKFETKCKEQYSHFLNSRLKKDDLEFSIPLYNTKLFLSCKAHSNYKILKEYLINEFK